MRRRLFVKKFGQGISTSLIGPGLLRSGNVQHSDLEYQYPKPGNLDDARNDEGYIVIRIEFEGASENLEERIIGHLKAKKVKFVRSRAYFNMGSNLIDTEKHKLDLSAVKGDKHIRYEDKILIVFVYGCLLRSVRSLIA